MANIKGEKTFQNTRRQSIKFQNTRRQSIKFQNTRRQSIKFHRQTTNYARVQFLFKSDIVVP